MSALSKEAPVSSRDGRQLVDEATRRGWEVVRRRGHVVLRWPPTNGRLVVPSTPSDWRSVANCRSLMRRMEAAPAAQPAEADR